MIVLFDPRQGLIKIGAELWGPTGSAVLQLALDTGATSTIISVAMLVAVGYHPAATSERIQVTTGSVVEFAARITVARIRALGQKRTGFAVLGHTLPPSASVDGLLGLDFLRGQRLMIDFRNGQVTLT